jgi:hypothetical protein
MAAKREPLSPGAGSAAAGVLPVVVAVSGRGARRAARHSREAA